MTEGEARDLRMRCLALAAGNVEEATRMYLFVAGAAPVARTPATLQAHTSKTDDAATAALTAAEING